MSENKIGANYMLMHSDWELSEEAKIPSFRMIPLTSDCLYSEMIYSPVKNILYLVSSRTSEQFRFVPRIDSNGDTVPSKKNPKTNAQERKVLNLPNEYELKHEEDIKQFIELMAFNHLTFDWQKFTVKIKLPDGEQKSKIIIEK